MNFDNLILKRQSCRSYDSNKYVSKDDLLKIVNAGHFSPSARNTQPWFYHIVTNVDKVESIRNTCQLLGFNKFTNEVNSFIVIEEKKPLLNTTSKDFSSIDIGSTTAYMTLKATDLGLSTCIIGAFSEEKTKETLGLSKTSRIRLILAVGYANEDDKLRDKNRKDLKDITNIYE